MTITDLFCGAGVIVVIIAAFGALVSGMRIIDSNAQPVTSDYVGDRYGVDRDPGDPAYYTIPYGAQTSYKGPGHDLDGDPYAEACDRAQHKPCAASGPTPVCPNCKPSGASFWSQVFGGGEASQETPKAKAQPRQEPKQQKKETRREKRQEAPKAKAEPQREYYEQPKPKMKWNIHEQEAIDAASRAEANFAEFKNKWAGRSPKDIRREGQKKYHPDRHRGNKDYYQRMSANINAWVDELEGKGRR